jgi:TRAP-type C4-dicarboxylate transport system permease small subunit
MDSMRNIKTIVTRYIVTPIFSFSRVMLIVSTVVLVAMMLLTVSDVFLRYILKNPVPDSQEITEYLMICVAFLGMAWVAVKNENITVDLIVPRFSPRVQAIFDSVTYLLGLVVVALISWRSFTEAPVSRDIGWDSLLLGIPEYPFLIVLGFGLAILCLVMIIQFVQHLYKAVKG